MILKIFKQKLLNIILFLLSLIAKFLAMFQILFGYIIEKILFSSKYVNLHFKSFYSDLIIIRKLRFQDISIDVKINSFWDYWRMFEYEKVSAIIILIFITIFLIDHTSAFIRSKIK